MCLSEYESCELCSRMCHVNRNLMVGFCGVSSKIKVGRASLHHWEEPCISGSRGSGTVFFSGCTLRCCYCQNYKLSRYNDGVIVTEEKLADIFIDLEKQGAHNINLVTAEHFAPGVKIALNIAKKRGMNIPIILNSSGYVSEKTLKILEDVIDIYLVDFKYMDAGLSEYYSAARDYPEVAKTALKRMVELRGGGVYDEDGIMQSGVIVRHLCLPTHSDDSKNIIRYLNDAYGERVVLSIMSQYTPVPEAMKYPELSGKLPKKEYDDVIDFCINLGIENAFIQEGDAADESFIPEFNGRGI